MLLGIPKDVPLALFVIPVDGGEPLIMFLCRQDDIELRQRAEAAFCAPRMSNWLLKLRWTDWICIQFVWKGTASKWSFLSNPSDWRRSL
ncbi:hypothetical protein D918_04228 [Trichuris suis]|nr:hypothetical protein D918_04228 [Trichuris suis]